MTILNPKSLSTASVSWDSHQEHAARLIRLEEFRENHESEHEKHVATREMLADVRTLVYKITGTLVLVIAGLSAARSIFGF